MKTAVNHDKPEPGDADKNKKIKTRSKPKNPPK